jgi:ribosome-binding protein aMBF1 (putative translation factor)
MDRESNCDYCGKRAKLRSTTHKVEARKINLHLCDSCEALRRAGDGRFMRWFQRRVSENQVWMREVRKRPLGTERKRSRGRGSER